MFALLCAVLVQDDLGTFLADLEKRRAGGADAKALVESIDAFADGKPDGVRVRLAWNRAHVAGIAAIEERFMEGLQKRVGKPVEFGGKRDRIAGTLLEIKKDRVTMEMDGGRVDIMLAQITPEMRLQDLKKRKVIGEAGVEEAAFRGASDLAAGLAVAEKIEDATARSVALDAFAGLALQGVDRDLAAKKHEKVGADLAAWAKKPALMDAAKGALRAFAQEAFPPMLVQASDEALAKDRKRARALLDLAASLTKSDDVKKQIAERQWSVLAPGDWYKLPIDAAWEVTNGKIEGGKILLEDAAKDAAVGVRFLKFPMKLGDIAGVRATVKPGASKAFSLQWETDAKRRQGYSVTVWAASKLGGWGVSPGDGRKPETKSSKEVAKKGDYELRIEATGTKLRFFIDATEVGAADAPVSGDAEDFVFVIDDGKGEVTSLSVRKK